jgi:aspartyl/asparaginyl-tRNA synthetase
MLLALFFCIGCSSLLATPIKKILDNPRDYSDKTVTVSGEVTETFSLLVIKYFTVRDDTGEITVVTTKPLPRKGSRITVKGTVQEAFSLGEQQVIVIVESDEREKEVK